MTSEVAKGREHLASKNCWCNPKNLPDEPSVWVHNDIDHARLVTTGGGKDSK